MINTQYTAMLGQKDIIFEIFHYATARAAEIGTENVFDFSLGNPSVPTPTAVNNTMIRKLSALNPLTLHGYSPNKGLPAVREQLATDLNRKYDCHYTSDHIFITAGASGALAHALRAVTNPGDEVITFTPCFPEYYPYAAGAGIHLKTLPADTDTFQIPLELLKKEIGEHTAAVLINTPNNPSGVVYSTETIRRLSKILTEHARILGHPIFLISDEPYRDILFDGADSPYVAGFYPDTLTCYSFSKSLSLPGERIGYLAVNPECAGAETIIDICPQISRTIGHNGAAALMQHTVGDTCGLTADLAVYEKNKNLLYKALLSYGYSCVEPSGAFYMFPRSLEPDDEAFCKKAMALDLMLVPGSAFGCPGYFRIAYCVPTERVKRSLPIFERLAKEYRDKGNHAQK
jgi:aspartate aminotransferase